MLELKSYVVFTRFIACVEKMFEGSETMNVRNTGIQ